MAEKLTTYKKIKDARAELEAICKELNKTVNSLVGANYKAEGSRVLMTQSTNINRIFCSAEKNLTEAHKAANALESVKTIPKAKTLKYKIQASTSKEIMVKRTDALTNVSNVKNNRIKLENLKTKIQKSYNEIENLNVTEQLVSSLNVIDVIYPLIAANKLTKLVIVKEYGTTNLKQAKKDVEKLIQYFKTIESGINSSVNKFMDCESGVKEKLYSKILATTAVITETSNTPKKDIEEKIAELEEKQKEYQLLYGSECQAIKDEIARLKKLLTPEYVTREQLVAMGWKNITDEMLFDLNRTLDMYQINTPARICHFISQCAHESGCGKWMTEIGSEAYFANKPYGYKYRGGGYIQLTWESNYRAFSNAMGDPEILNQGADYVGKYYPWSSAGFWWNRNGMNKLIDSGATVEQVTKRVNGGYNGLQDRKNHYNKAVKIFM